MELKTGHKICRFQFALTLLCHGRFVRASRILSQCIAIERRDDNMVAQHLFAAQIAIEHLEQYDVGKPTFQRCVLATEEFHAFFYFRRQEVTKLSSLFCACSVVSCADIGAL